MLGILDSQSGTLFTVTSDLLYGRLRLRPGIINRAHAKPRVERKSSGVKTEGAHVDSKLQLDSLDKIQSDISKVT